MASISKTATEAEALIFTVLMQKMQGDVTAMLS
jgi:hypothetical protein